MTRFEKAIYIFWGIVISGLLIFQFVTSDAQGKIGIILCVLILALFIIVPFAKAVLILTEKEKYYNTFSGFTVFFQAVAKVVSLISLYVFSALMINKFAGAAVLQSVMGYDLFATPLYDRFITFLLQYSKDFQMLNFHRSLSLLVSVLPESYSIFFYIVAVVTFVLFLAGFLIGTTDNNKGKVGVFVDYFIFGNMNLLLDHMLIFLIIIALVAIVPIAIIFILIFSNADSGNTNSVQLQEDGGSYFPSTLLSSSDSSKTLYYVSSQYENRATYRNEDGNYIDVVRLDGVYYDSSTKDQYY